MRSTEQLSTAAQLLRPRLASLILALALGTLSVASSLGLTGVSAWLITRAWQMPPILDLSIAVVTVRTLAISRGVLHYCERLASHDTALRATGTARALIYQRLARGPADVASRLNTGELVSRVGSDVDQLADVLVRTLLPAGVAAILGLAAVTAVGLISALAAAVLAVCLVVAGVVAPWLAARSAMAQERIARQRHSRRDVSAMLALEHAHELRVAGRLADVIAESQRRQHEWADAVDAAARPAALAQAIPTAAVGISVLGAVIAGIQLAGSVAPTTLAVLMLLPLSAFEATTLLPAAAIQLTRSRLAASRLLPLAPSAESAATNTGVLRCPDARLRARNLVAGQPGGPISAAVDVDLPAGARLAITGPSGSGKTTLLMTLAGLLPPASGDITLGGVPLHALPEHERGCAVSFFAEDAHVFSTTVRDNLLVARGDCPDDELVDALQRVGLGTWLSGLPTGLDTVLSGGAQALSAGQRRRLLLARALISPARIVLLDEPTEHLDAVDADAVLRSLLTWGPDSMFEERTVVVATPHPASNIRCVEMCLGADAYSGQQSSMSPDQEASHDRIFGSAG